MRHKPSDSGTEWHESVDADGGPMAVDWQDPDNAFGISNGQFIRTTNGGDSWNRPGSGDISCMPMSGAAAVDPNDGQHVYVPTNNGTLNSDGSRLLAEPGQRRDLPEQGRRLELRRRRLRRHAGDAAVHRHDARPTRTSSGSR